MFKHSYIDLLRRRKELKGSFSSNDLFIALTKGLLYKYVLLKIFDYVFSIPLFQCRSGNVFKQ